MNIFDKYQNKKVVKEAEIVNNEHDRPDVQVSIVNVGQCTINSEHIISQMTVIIDAMAATSPEQFAKIRTIYLEVPFAIVNGHPSIKSVDLK